ncbi:terpene synthase family protein [Streptomyces sp. B1866]|uniref:terpene synthase family protein n=1 Tax=Streptomyces sp. B1866 TaxID=3075431 RepID=UPI00288DDEE4|nr:terpene synthase family protein [Streptomyces sp. B1866]MDT3396401.1 terpene synthase family protein [Streptomyces sp. B1866]
MDQPPRGSSSIPSLWCPLPSRIHPQRASITEFQLEWSVRHRLAVGRDEIARLARTDIAGLAARFVPRATLTGAQTLAILLTATFVIDDLNDDGRLRGRPDDFAHYASALSRALGPGPLAEPADPPVRALHDIGRRLTHVASPALAARIVRDFRATLAAEVRESTNNARRLPPDLDTYVQNRLATTWVLPLTDLAAAVDGVEPALADLDRPEVRALTEMTSLILGFDNDICGYAKDRRDGAVDVNNLPDVLARATGAGPAQALAQAVSLRDQVLAHWLRLYDRLGETAGPAPAGHLANLASMISGHLHWAAACPRHTIPHGGPVIRISPARRACDAPAADRLDVPSIAWWRDLPGTPRAADDGAAPSQRRLEAP